ncbi:HU family DNA-binding protein [Streptomyces hydrogenans]|uniref:HU family DNA-binding protein n=1 Tax=Streptomyces hydrogenans TaxID=1873719 RepID=UPI003690E3BB
MTRRIIGAVTATSIEQLLSAELDLTPAEAGQAVHLVFQTITTAVAAGHSATIPGFGVFAPHETTEPTLGAVVGHEDQPVTLPPHQKILFWPDDRLSQIVRDRDLLGSIRPPAAKTTGSPA